MQIEHSQEDFYSIDAYDGYGENAELESLEESSGNMTSSWILGFFMLLAGIFMLVIVNASIGPAFLALFFLILGLIIHVLPGLRCPYARRAFILSFCTCVLITGLAQTYAKVNFGTLQNTIDAGTFHRLTSGGVGGGTLEDLSSIVNAPLPVIVWQYLYSVCVRMGLDNGPWVGIMLNSFLVGIAGSILIRAAKYIFGNDDRRLRRLGTLFALCGMFWLFGAIFIRDSFALVLNVLLLWAFVRGLSLPSTKNFLIILGTLLFASITMRYVREGLESVFLVFVLLAIFSWTRRFRSGIVTLMLFLVGTFVAITLFPMIASRVGIARVFIEQQTFKFGRGLIAGGSLGLAFVVNQPMPIRLIVGSLYMLISPIPLWNNFSLSMPEYHWLKGLEGVFLVCIVPAALVGLYQFIRKVLKGGYGAAPSCFIASYAVVTLLAIAATSLETRHHGQFLPAILLLAAVPDKHDPAVRNKLRAVMFVWLSMVIGGHVMWVALKKF